VAQERLVTPGDAIVVIPLAPKDFENGPLFPRFPEPDGDINFLLRVAYRHDTLLRRVERLRFHATISFSAALTCTAYGR
jgi:hypothetical protein